MTIYLNFETDTLNLILMRKMTSVADTHRLQNGVGKQKNCVPKYTRHKMKQNMDDGFMSGCYTRVKE